jgi:hypothetical protein
MKIIALYLGTIILLALSLGCSSRSNVARTVPPPTPAPTPDETVRSWPSAPNEYMSDNQPLKLAWNNFERSQNYRLAQPSDRNLTPAAEARVRSNSPHQIVPVINWWGARGYRGANTNDFLIAIMVDPARSDSKRYGLLVMAAVASEGRDYKPFWVSQEEDMESYLLSPASGSVYIECFSRDGTEQTKELVWDKKSRQFRLV